ncbi:ribosome maturation factor [Sulfurimonas sp.]|uniref:ribosome maturation factor n=1 Tax=Sulfurimonas sp. TaxID=2022749 RepID=UPI00263014E2|nr:ribosome maturation factor [Sulfurimonas sp.]
MSLNSDIESIVRSLGLELYDTAVVSEHDETIFRISVISNEFEDGKRKSVNLEKYVELTHLISPLLDVTPPVSSEYRLEVGSPGIERKLTTLGHFKKSVGEDMKIVLGEKDKIKGKLLKVEGNTLFFETEDGLKEIDFHDIEKAKTYFEW